MSNAIRKPKEEFQPLIRIGRIASQPPLWAKEEHRVVICLFGRSKCHRPTSGIGRHETVLKVFSDLTLMCQGWFRNVWLVAVLLHPYLKNTIRPKYRLAHDGLKTTPYLKPELSVGAQHEVELDSAGGVCFRAFPVRTRLGHHG